MGFKEEERRVLRDYELGTNLRYLEDENVKLLAAKAKEAITHLGNLDFLDSEAASVEFLKLLGHGPNNYFTLAELYYALGRVIITSHK